MTDQTQTTVNTPLLAKVLDHIVAHPEEWNQMWWGQRTACGTAYCVAGHAVVMSGHDIVWDDNGRAQRTQSREISLLADELLGVNFGQGNHLYAATNTLRDLHRLANEYTNGEIAIPDELPDGS